MFVAFLPTGAKKKSALEVVRSPQHAHHRLRLVAFYEKHAPEKLDDVDALLAKSFATAREARWPRRRRSTEHPASGRGGVATTRPQTVQL